MYKPEYFTHKNGVFSKLGVYWIIWMTSEYLDSRKNLSVRNSCRGKKYARRYFHEIKLSRGEYSARRAKFPAANFPVAKLPVMTYLCVYAYACVYIFMGANATTSTHSR